MITPAALALTILFLADDPTLPAVVVEVRETPARTVTIFFVDENNPSTVQLGDSASDAVAGSTLRWPLLPRGASLTPAVDGVILTIDDAGAWTTAFQPPAPPPTTTTKGKTGTAKKAASSHPWPPPSLPTATASTLRLFVPTVVDGVAGSASLHGQGFAVAGTAVAWERPLSPQLVTIAGTDVDLSAPTIAATAAPAGECAPVATIVLQPTTVSAASPPACAGGFAVSVVNGTRYAEKKAGDLPARGILIVAAPKR